MTRFDPECSFCQIIRENRTPTVYADEHTTAFFPLNPASDGHTLVVPKTHIPDVFSLDLQLASHLTRTTLLVAAALKAAFEPEGMNIVNSAGEVASQTVPHLHVHLVPRWTGDRIGNIWPPSTPVSDAVEKAQLERVREQLRKSGSGDGSPQVAS